jgi:hypothetical protein
MDSAGPFEYPANELGHLVGRITNHALSGTSEWMMTHAIQHKN